MVLREFIEYFHYALEEKSDARTVNWLLISSPWPTLLIVMAYLFVVIKGPNWMQNRPAIDLKSTMVLYNFGLVLLSVYMLYEFVVTAWLRPGFSILCEPVNYSSDPLAHRLASACWWYYFSKIIELMDTIFFVLRKKNNQISFLHVYHHSTMPLLWWVGVRFVSGGVSFFPPSINVFVHIVMYTYYMLSAMGPHMQKYLWWKKYMTKLQLFFLVAFHSLTVIYLDCGYPVIYEYMLFVYISSHILLFSNFYYHSYMKRGQKSVGTKHDNSTMNAPGLCLGKGDSPVLNGSIMSNGVQNGSVKKYI